MKRKDKVYQTYQEVWVFGKDSNKQVPNRLKKKKEKSVNLKNFKLSEK